MLVDEVEPEPAVDVAVGREWDGPVAVGEGEVAGMALGGVSQRDEDVPGGGDYQEDDEAGDWGELLEAVEDCSCIAASESEVSKDDEDGEDYADEALGEDVEGAAAGEGPAEEWAWSGGKTLGGERPHDRRDEAAPIMGHPTLFGEPVAVEGQGEPEADHRVGDGDAGEDEDGEAGEKNESGVEAGPGAGEGPTSEGFGDEREGEDCEGEWEAGGGGADAEEFEAGRHGPVEERGLFEVADAVGVEGYPVVAKKHLAGDLGVDGVGVVEERRGDESEASVEEEPESEEDEAVGLDCGLGGSEGDWHCEDVDYQPSLREG
jgi:hypothetical protein